MQRESRLIAQSNATKKQAQNLECLSKIMQLSWKRFEGRAKQKVAFAQWRMFLQNSRLAESAFEQMMELHQKHALQRFETASNLIWKINIRYSYRTTLEKLINTAIEHMQDEQLSLQNQARLDEQMARNRDWALR